MGGGSAVTRKVSSAPCSRSNSAAGGVPNRWGFGKVPKRLVCKLAGKNSSATAANGNGGGGDSGGGGSKARVLSLNVPMCIGYKQHLSCRSDESSAVSVTSSAAVGGGASGGQSGGSGSGGGGGRAGNLFNLRGLFSKKVY
ncbi:hypothetical protein LOK49_LG09G00208 [Camellia lanceoleosa]|uniref:Uncharacterized protein n=1 Tax=Camellia lanceoleosa TaxID=1840588 RepID=A0ACC0GKP8_9ERIC|nr:hypothetical protein LOK49_LG09G00208 [Camellia lanceoleosa]